MRFVLDASAALYALSAADHGTGLLGPHQLVAPALLWSEVTAELHAAVIRREITADAATAALDALDLAGVDRFAALHLHRRAWDVAERLGWGRTYDAEYVALAELLEIPLLTLDARLARGASRLFSVLGPCDLPT